MKDFTRGVKLIPNCTKGKEIWRFFNIKVVPTSPGGGIEFGGVFTALGVFTAAMTDSSI